MDLLGPYVRPGRGQGKGRRALYHPTAPRLVVFLARELGRTRSLDVAGWRAWLAGYPITAFARRRLEAELQRWERDARLSVALERPRTRRDKKVVHQAPRDAQSIALNTILLGLATLRGLPIAYADLFRTMLPSTAIDGLDVARLMEMSRDALNVTSMRQAATAASDRTLECVRDSILLVARVAGRIVEGLEARWTQPPVVLLGLVLASTRLDPDIPTLGEIIRQESPSGLRRLCKGGMPPDGEWLLQLARQVRTEIRHERRHAKLL